MLRYITKRTLMVIPVMLGVLVIVFFLQAITPADAADMLLPDGTDEEKGVLREEMGLDNPLIQQFGRYVYDLVTKGDFGTSYKTRQPVAQELMVRLPITIVLALGSVLLGVTLGVPLGVISAVKQYTWVDSTILVISMVTAAMPSFWLALLCISLLSVQLGWLPASGINNPLGWIMPISVVGLNTMSAITRITRSSMLEIIRQDYIRTARAKGQKESAITIRHALRSALIPIIAQVGNQLGIQLGGVIAIEAVFGIPGIGKYIVDAISYRNFPSVQGGVVILAFVLTFVNLIVDITYAIVDPRLKSTISVSSKKIAKGAVNE